MVTLLYIVIVVVVGIKYLLLVLINPLILQAGLQIRMLLNSGLVSVQILLLHLIVSGL
nr:MAG TPA: hypothetical protein [Caudoviricetes sp.]